MSLEDNYDALSDVFSTLRLRGELYFHAELQGPFSVALPPEQQHIRFHLVRQGRCWLTPSGGTPEPLVEGDLAIVPNGAAQVLASDPALTPAPLEALLASAAPDGGVLGGGVLRYGEGAPTTRLLCGFCRFDEGIAHPLLASLPPHLVLRRADLGAEPWAATALRLLALEADLGGQGTVGVLSRLLEVVFVQAVRRMTATGDGPGNGYMAALADRQLSRALLAMHRRPETAWTIGALAKLAGMSRARFAARFAAAVGLPPIGYLTTWRLIKARGLLAGSDLDMAEIAGRCGYQSVPSFTRRFKQAFGTGPGAYRRAARMER